AARGVGRARSRMAATTARPRAARRAAGWQRRVLLLSVAARRLAAGAVRLTRARRARSRCVRRAAARRAAESRARGEAPLELGSARRTLRECVAWARRRRARAQGRQRVPRAVR